jgi:hypothetical protein
VFEQYTEKARRAIFFSRYEASQLGSSYIETEHLLLGLIREGALHDRLSQSPSHVGESVRKQIESQTPVREKISASVDMPLSLESVRVLAYAFEEASALQHEMIDADHLLLGLLREKGCFAATLLQQRGIDLESYREKVRTKRVTPGIPPRLSEPMPSRRERSFELQSESYPAEEKEALAPLLRPAVAAVRNLRKRAIEHLHSDSDLYFDRRLKRSPWSRKEALGHLIDFATAHHQWLARALTEPKLTGIAYPEDDWVRAQEYRNASWPDIVDLWISLNAHLVHVLTVIPEEKVNMSCRIGVEEPISLLQLITRYVWHCEDIMGQILSRLA